jgi:GNAT superfamily N-acetyltransferase
MIEIREANETDNQALIELQRKCPQGTSLILNVDSSPDFFARSKPFKDWSVLVAVDDDIIVGSAGYAVSDVFVDGRLVKTAYEYGFMVDPRERRKGIAVKLQEFIEQNGRERNVDLLYINIIQDNLPSEKLFSKLGFEKVKDCATLSLMTYKKQRPVKEANVRSADESDLIEIVSMINEMYKDYSFFHPFKKEDLLEYVKRMPGFDLHNLFVFQDDQGIKACLGYWDYAKVRKYIIERFNWALKAQLLLTRIAGLLVEVPHIPNPGEPLLSFNLILLAFKDAESLADLVKHIINIALENGVNFLHMPVDMESPEAEVLSRFRHTKVGLQFFIKPLSEERFSRLGENKLYIDTIEM